MLLVGGGSERFGSPKALATLDGETLAERAWRVLEEACDEAIAVGKASDALPLRFPIVDDSTAHRAPIYGVVAGLRAAAHDICVIVPVDCPLVTVEVVRSLGEALAVPQTGPLPGAYSKAMLPELETRVARGTLSLRGVNPNVLQVDERLLVDVDTAVELSAVESIAWIITRS